MWDKPSDLFLSSRSSGAVLANPHRSSPWLNYTQKLTHTPLCLLFQFKILLLLSLTAVKSTDWTNILHVQIFTQTQLLNANILLITVARLNYVHDWISKLLQTASFGLLGNIIYDGNQVILCFQTLIIIRIMSYNIGFIINDIIVMMFCVLLIVYTLYKCSYFSHN